MIFRQLIAVTFSLLALAACKPTPATFNTELVDAALAQGIEAIFVVTSRQKSDDPALMYNEKRSPTLNFERLRVGVPARHDTGQLERGNRNFDPEKVFSLVGRQNYASRQQMRAAVNRALDKFPPGQREIFIYVHGFNNSFAAGVFRHAQMRHDFGVPAVALHYAWPSAGLAEAYVYDRDSAIYAQDGLAQTVEFALSTKADNVILLAHSMGSLVTMQGLRLLAVTGKRSSISKLEAVVLAAPDVDIDVFDKMLGDMGRARPKRFVVMVSEKDRALRLSSRLRGGHPRVGQGKNIQYLQDRGIAVVDLANIGSGGHSTFSDSPAFISLVRSGALENTLRQANVSQQANGTVITQSAEAVGKVGNLIIFGPQKLLTGN